MQAFCQFVSVRAVGTGVDYIPCVISGFTGNLNEIILKHNKLCLDH